MAKGDFKRKVSEFMYGRYGNDKLNTFIIIIAVILFIPYYILRSWTYDFIFSILITLLLILTIFRSFSRNVYKRSHENDVFLKIVNYIPGRIKFSHRRFKERKEYKYVKCPSCKSYLRLRKPPKGKTIEITCTKCSRTFRKKM